MDLNRIASFVAAAETGVLSRAAERLGQQVSTVSRHISDLEADLGATLFERTGRGVRLTPAGERFLDRGRQVLRELELGRAEVRGDAVREPTLLRLSGPPDLAQQVLPPVLATLSQQFPALQVHSRSDTRRVSLVEESYDAVVRLGPLAPSDLLARKVGSLTLRLYAAPGHGVDSLDAATAREFVLVEGRPPEVPVKVRGAPAVLRPSGRLVVGSLAEAAAIAAHSGRLVVLPSFTALPFIAQGTLSAAARWLSFPAVDVHLLRTARHRRTPALEALGDLLADALAELERGVV